MKSSTEIPARRPARAPSTKRPLTRRNADRHLLYQWSVQNPEFETELIEKVCRRRKQPKPLILREDFCGTAYAAAHWVKTDPNRVAIGLDLDKPTIRWGLKHNIAPLGEAADRIDLRLQDVRTITTPKVDVVTALNFSYYLFTDMSALTEYFRKVHASMKPGGVILLDTYGGWESQQVKKESRTVSGPRGSFTYIWDQSSFNPVDNMTRCYIHFKFRDGTKWEKAFTYHWRLYTPAEVNDALTAAGFKNVDVWWDREDDEDEDDDYRPARRAENCPGWISYMSAQA